MNSSVKTGRQGENLAAEYLKKKGYIILARNFRAFRGEIDIIAQTEDTLVFVEVKSGYSKSFGDPKNWVTERKQQQIGKTALAYLQEMDIYDQDCRFDVIAITYHSGEPRVNHIEDAFWL